MKLKSLRFRAAGEILRTSLAGYSSIFFMSSPMFGAVILALSFWYPSIGIHGLGAELLSIAYWGWKTRNHKSSEKLMPPFNAILCGTFVGYWLQPGIKSALFLLAVWYTNLIFRTLLESTLGRKGYPILSLPFSLTCLIFGIPIRAHSQAVAAVTFSGFWKSIVLWSTGSVFWDQLFQSLGSVIFIPVTAVGALIFSLILLHSRFLAVGILASVSGSWAIHTLLYLSLNSLSNPDTPRGSIPIGFWNYSHFNFALIGAAAGGTFFIPSLATLPLIFASFWACLISYYGLLYLFQFQVEHIHAFPLCFGSLVGVCLAKKTFPQGLNQSMVRPLENALAYLKVRRQRFGESPCVLDLPLRESTRILQGPNGPWTHQGKWKNAIDFICVGSNGRSFANNGEALSDYFIYGKTVVAPASGWIIRLEDHCEDQPIGKLSFRRNWGNWILLKSHSGFHILMAHLKQNSVLVKEGSYVEVGQPLAQVGNTGYSAEPHLHLQVQEGIDLDSETLPYHFRCFEVRCFKGRGSDGTEGKIHLYQTPQTGDLISPLRANQTLQWALNFKPNQELCFESEGQKVRFRSGLDSRAGTWFFEEVGSRGRAYFWKDNSEFYFYDWKNVNPNSPLSWFSMVLNRVPFVIGSNWGSNWQDFVTSDRLPWLLASLSERAIKALAPWKSNPKIDFRVEADGSQIYGNISCGTRVELSFEVSLDPWVGIRSFRVGDKIWNRTLPLPDEVDREVAA